MKYLLILALGTWLASAPSGCGPGPAACTGKEVCTQMFAMITVQITDSDGRPAQLDDVYTVRTSSGAILRLQHSGNGMYTVLDDSYIQQLKGSSDTFRLVGTRNGTQVVSENYVIGADCCHVQRSSGPTEIKL